MVTEWTEKIVYHVVLYTQSKQILYRLSTLSKSRVIAAYIGSNKSDLIFSFIRTTHVI